MSEFEKLVVLPLREVLISKLNYKYDPNDDPNGVYKPMMNENYCLFNYYSEDDGLVLGFYHGNDKQFSPLQKKYFTEILERPEFNDEFSELLDWGNEWICKKFIGKEWEPKEIFEYLFPRFQLLELTVNILKIV